MLKGKAFGARKSIASAGKIGRKIKRLWQAAGVWFEKYTFKTGFWNDGIWENRSGQGDGGMGKIAFTVTGLRKGISKSGFLTAGFAKRDLQQYNSQSNLQQ